MLSRVINLIDATKLKLLWPLQIESILFQEALREIRIPATLEFRSAEAWDKWSFGFGEDNGLSICWISGKFCPLSFPFHPSSGKCPALFVSICTTVTSHVFTLWMWKIAGDGGGQFGPTAASFTANLAMWDHGTQWVLKVFEVTWNLNRCADFHMCDKGQGIIASKKHMKKQRRHFRGKLSLSLV